MLSSSNVMLCNSMSALSTESGVWRPSGSDFTVWLRVHVKCVCGKASNSELKSEDTSSCLEPAWTQPFRAALPKAIVCSQTLIIQGLIIPPLPSLGVDLNHLVYVNTVFQQWQPEAKEKFQSHRFSCCLTILAAGYHRTCPALSRCQIDTV